MDEGPPHADTSRVDPKYLNLLKQGLLLPALAEWREQNPGRSPSLTRAFLSDADLKGADLSSVDLSEADLSDAILSGANLSDADLRGATLLRADLSGADLRRANLDGANLSQANLRKADLSDAFLHGADLDSAQLSGAELNRAQLVEATLVDAVLANATGREANFSGARLTRSDLSGADLADANLIDSSLHSALLRGAILRGAVLWRADLTNAICSGADLTEAQLTEANLWEADFRQAKLAGAGLMNAVAVGADFTDADLTGCQVYGISAWDLKAEGAIQSKLVITRTEPHVQVDDLEVAQFIYLLLNRRKLRDVLTTLGEKAVLVLGRFTERKPLLDAIADRLRELDYLPIIFDFERPTDRDITETVKILAGLSLFVIADVTNPRSVPLELQATVPDYMIPFVTVLQRGQPVFGMFDDLPAKYDWALPLLEYNTAESLLAAFDQKVVAPALEKLEDIRRRKALVPVRRSAEG
jgi:uncharacterized protein YjbI with pentapeptide repeats